MCPEIITSAFGAGQFLGGQMYLKIVGRLICGVARCTKQFSKILADVGTTSATGGKSENWGHACVVCGSRVGYPCSQAGVLVKFVLISRAHAKITTTTASVHGGARSARPCTQAVLVVIFSWALQIGANFTRTPAWLHGYPPLLPQTTIVLSQLRTPRSYLLYCFTNNIMKE